jgi:hypothetical protein
MQTDAMQAAVQPFMKLVHGNMTLLSQFSASPEVLAQAMSNTQSLFQQGQGSVATLTQSDAFAQLMQGMFRNYTEFMTDLGQSGMAMMAQGGTAMMQKAQEASTSLAGTATRSRRAA